MRKSLVLTVFVLIFLIAIPGITSAAGIVPEKCQSAPCQACDLIATADNLMRFAVYFATVVATLMFMYAGFLYISSSASPENIARAHKIFFNVLFGFIIVLVAWLIVATLIRVFMGQNQVPWSAILCNEAARQQAINNQSGITTGTQQTRPGTDTRTAEQKAADEARVRAELEAAGVKVYNGACGVNESYQQHRATYGVGCTDVSSLQPATVNFLKTLGAQRPVTLTGGNEDGHITHGDGNRVDLPLSMMSVNNLTLTTKQSTLGPYYKDVNGNCWLKESDHWHVDVGFCK